MFIESKVNHKIFGSGIITNIEINPINQIKSKITINFDSGKISKFSIEAFGSDGFFTTDDEEIIPFVDNLKEEEEKKRKEAIRKRAESIVYIPSYNFNEIEREVTKEDWEKAAKVAEVYRFPNESRAVVMDEDLIFINASAALRYIEARIKDGDKLYKSCDKNKKYLGHYWKYASKEQINHIIKLFEKEENDIK